MQGLANVILSMQPEGDLAFLKAWQHEVVAAAQKVPGFRDSEEFEQIPQVQDRWVLVLRFQSDQGLRQWLESDVRRALMAKGAPLSPRQEVIAGPGSSVRPVTLVIPTRVPAEKREEFRAWQAEMNALERTFPGFIESRLVEPVSGEEWTIVMRFDSKEHVESWLQSEQRQILMAKIDAGLHGQERQLVVDFGGWFEAAPRDGRPASWKQMLSVLIAIYPVVMLTMLYIDPPLTSLHMPLFLSVLRGNLLSCCLLTWLIMPRLTGALSFWLQPRPRQPTWWEPAGTVLVLAILGGWSLLFFGLTR
ncbi:antibiotic biosynthesis monooxygenase [bacterium]|nr:antibiotic biosynthesis monooxygenase [bacterium]